MADKNNEKIIANEFLQDAAQQMANRAQLRDQPAGERSIATTVRAFNALTGHNLSEQEGWEFMILLKMVRGRQGKFNKDDYVDMAAYAGLLGECESMRNREPAVATVEVKVFPGGGGTSGGGGGGLFSTKAETLAKYYEDTGQ